MRYSGSHFSPDLIPRGDGDDFSAAKLSILQKGPKFSLLKPLSNRWNRPGGLKLGLLWCRKNAPAKPGMANRLAVKF